MGQGRSPILVQVSASPCICSVSTSHFYFCHDCWLTLNNFYLLARIALDSFLIFCILQRRVLIYPHPLTHLHLILLPSLPLWPRGIWFGWARDKRDVSDCGTEQTHLSFLPFFIPPLAHLLLSSPLLSRLCDYCLQ